MTFIIELVLVVSVLLTGSIDWGESAVQILAPVVCGNDHSQILAYPDLTWECDNI
jgi:hypothetical protein